MRNFKTILASAVVGASLVMCSPAYAQAVPAAAPAPADTQARTAANLVNQVSAANFKAVAEHPATANNILSQAAAAAASRMLSIGADNYQEMSAIRAANLATMLRKLGEQSVQNSLATSQALSSRASQEMMMLLATINGGGVAVKSMQTVPPVSAPVPVR